MPWITSSSPQLMFSCYPLLCGTKLKCVELDRLGGDWNPLACGVFSLLCPTTLTPTKSHTYTHTPTKCKAKGFNKIKRKGREQINECISFFCEQARSPPISAGSGHRGS